MSKSRLIALLLGSLAMVSRAQERQLTSSAKNHELDQNDNFSPDGGFLCYDTRETFGPGIDRCRSIESVEIATGRERVLYMPPFNQGELAAPGVGAASYSPVAKKIIFIHGPPLQQLAARGPYAKTNRNGARIAADGTGGFAWLDFRDVATDRPTTPGAHRGGTHRHEYSFDGNRIGFTYDDALLPQYDRTIGYMEEHPRAPGGAMCWFAILVPVVPKDSAKPGEIEKAWEDSWVGQDGRMRAFIGKVRAADGVGYEQSLFVVDVPLDVKISTADPGTAERFPSPPRGVQVRRLTRAFAQGIVRGSPDGARIAYYGRDEDGRLQVFIIPSDGSDDSPDPAMRPIQATHFPEGAGVGLRWHPSGEAIVCACDEGIAAVNVTPGEKFGAALFLTPKADGPPRTQLVVSPDGKLVAYVRPVPTLGPDRKRAKNYAGEDFKQIFTVDFEMP